MLNLSIIIPVFNTKHLIEDCLGSCLNQDISREEYEIIVVDDGSTDGSGEVIKEYASQYSNVHYFYQENQKQGAARNNGLKHALGKYIWFVDSDDKIVDNVLNKILRLLSEKPSIEILRIKGERCLNGVCIEEQGKHKEHLVYSGQSLLEEDTYTVNIPFHIYSRDFLINDVGPMMEQVYFEDNEFVVRLCTKCKVFYYLPLLAYRVTLTNSSTTRKGSYVHFFDIISVMSKMILLYQEQGLSERAKHNFSGRIASCMNSALIGVKDAPKNEFLNLSRQLKLMDNLSTIISQSGSKTHGFQYFLLKYPKALRFLMRLYY